MSGCRWETFSRSLENVQVNGLDSGGNKTGEKKKMSGKILTNLLQRRIRAETGSATNDSNNNSENPFKRTTKPVSTNFIRREDEDQMEKPGNNFPSPSGIPPDVPKNPITYPRVPPKPPSHRHAIQKASCPVSTRQLQGTSCPEASRTSGVLSRTSSQSSGFEEGASSSNTDASVGEGSSWKNTQTIADLVSSYILPENVNLEIGGRREIPRANKSISHEISSDSQISEESEILSPNSVFTADEIFDRSSRSDHLRNRTEVPVANRFMELEPRKHEQSPNPMVRPKPKTFRTASLPPSSRFTEPTAEDKITTMSTSTSGLSVDYDDIDDVDAPQSSSPDTPDSYDDASMTSFDAIAKGNMTHNDYVMPDGTDDVNDNTAISKSFPSQWSSCSEISRQKVVPSQSHPSVPQPFNTGGGGIKKSVSFIAGDDDFGHYRLKPPGIETQMVLPVTERHRTQGIEGRPDADGSTRMGGLGRRFPTPNKPPIPAKTWIFHKDTGLDQISVTSPRNPGLIRRHSERINRSSDEIHRPTPSNCDVTEDVSMETDSIRVQDKTNKDSQENSKSLATSTDEVESLDASKQEAVTSIRSRPKTSDNVSTSIEKSFSSPKKPEFREEQFRDSSSHSGNESPSSDSIYRSREVQESTPNMTSLRRRFNPRFQSETSLADVETALELAKKFEEFNNRLAAMATAVARNSPKEKAPSGGKHSTRKDLETPSMGETVRKHAPGLTTKLPTDGYKDCTWKTGRFPLVEKLLSENWTPSDPGQTVDDDPDGGGEGDFSADFWDKTTQERTVGHSSETTTAMIQQVAWTTGPSDLEESHHSRSTSELFCRGQDDDSSATGSRFQGSFHPRRVTSCIDLENVDTSRNDVREPKERPIEWNGSGLPVMRSQSKRETGCSDPRPRKSLQRQGAELQTQFSRWHQQLMLEQNGGCAPNNNQEKSSSIKESFENSSSWKTNNTVKTQTPRQPQDSGTRESDLDLGHRSNLFWFPSDFKSELEEYLDGIPVPVNRDGDSGRRRKAVQRSASCVQSRGQGFPRTAMAKFNVDGTPRSILKRPELPGGSARSSNILKDLRNSEEEIEDYETDMRRNNSDSFDEEISAHVETSTPRLSSLLPPSPSIHHSPRSNNDLLSSNLHQPSPPPPPVIPSSPRSSPLPSSQSNSPLTSMTSRVTPEPPGLSSPASSGSSAASSPLRATDWGSSKFTGLQNLQRRTALMKRRSQSDLGTSACILDALRQN